MVDRDFSDAADREAYERLNLSEKDKKKVEEISKQQRAEIKHLENMQKERWDKDMATARKEIVKQHAKPKLKPSWDKGRAIPKEKVESLARRTVLAQHQQERDVLNARFEQEKNDIISLAFLEDRAAIKADSEQKKRDRSVTRSRPRKSDKDGRGR